MRSTDPDMEGEIEDLVSATREGILNSAAEQGLWSQTSQVHLPALLLIRMVTLGKLPNIPLLPLPLFSRLREIILYLGNGMRIK